MRVFSVAAVFALAGALTACSGGSSGSPAAGPPCVPHPIIGGGVLIAPAPNATNVPTSVGSVTVGYQAQLVGVSVVLQPNGSGSSVGGGPLTPSADGTKLTASVPALAANTMYFVEAQVVLAPCQGESFQFGSFTTQ